MTIASGPHFELKPATLARWLEERGLGTWWSVDGDPYLTGRLAFPAPTEHLVALLRKIDRPLLVRDLKHRKESRGQEIDWEELDEQVDQVGNTVQRFTGPEPDWFADRYFALCWKNRPTEAAEWLLTEDKATAKAFEGVDLPAAWG